MNKPIIAAYLLIALLVISLGFNFYQYSQTTTLNNQKNNAETLLEMTTLLTTVHVNVNTQLEKLDQSLKIAATQLSTIDLNSSGARTILGNLASNNSLIVNACTADARDIILAIMPLEYSGIEGEDISGQEQSLMLHETLQPVMSTMIFLVEGFYGVVMVVPIFNVNAAFVGSLSIVIQPYTLLQSAIVPAISGTPYSMWTMQTNGTLLYDPDPQQQGKNLFTDPIYMDYPTVQAFAHQVAASQTGYGTYQYHQDTVAGELVNKEAYWDTASIYGTQWRLVILNILET